MVMAMETEERRWAVTYTKHVKQKRKVYQDGVLLLHPLPSPGRLVLYDDAHNPIDARFIRKDETVAAGASIALEAHLVDVSDPQTHPDPSSLPASKVVHRGGAWPHHVPRGSQRFGNPAESGKADASSASGGGVEGRIADSTDSGLKEWSALYTTQLTQKAKKYHDGVLRLAQVGSHAKQIVLLDEEGGVLGSRYLKSGESVERGMKCQMPNYLIEICEPLNQKQDVFAKGSLEEDLGSVGPKSGENTSNKMGKTIKSPKFTSPLKFHDLQTGKSECTTSPNRPEIGKLTSNNMNDPRKFHDFQKEKSEWTSSLIRPVIFKSKPNNMNDPLRFADLQTGKTECATSSSRPEIGLTSNNMNDPLQFADLQMDLQKDKSEWTSSLSRPVIGKSTFNNMNDTLRTASQILSIMKKPPPEVRSAKSMPAALAHSSTSFVSKIVLEESHSKRAAYLSSGIDHSNRTIGGTTKCGWPQFANEYHTSADSCLQVETLEAKNLASTHHQKESLGNAHPTSDSPSIMRPEAFENPGLAMIDIPASDMNAEDQKVNLSSNHHTESPNDCAPFMNATSISGLQEDKSGTADQLCGKNRIDDSKCDKLSFLAARNQTWKNHKIQKLIDDCPTFDLGF